MELSSGHFGMGVSGIDSEKQPQLTDEAVGWNTIHFRDAWILAPRAPGVESKGPSGERGGENVDRTPGTSCSSGEGICEVWKSLTLAKECRRARPTVKRQLPGGQRAGRGGGNAAQRPIEKLSS